MTGVLWWWGYFYRPRQFDETYHDGAVKTLVFVHRRRAFQIPHELWTDARPSTFGWFWLPRMTTYYPDGSRQEHGWCRPIPVETGNAQTDLPPDGFARVGDWIGWHPKGAKAFEIHYRAGLKEGPSRSWHENGQLQEEGAYHQDVQTGPWVAWHENGKLQWRGEFVAGLKHGAWTTWHENGQLRAEPKFELGLQTGEELIHDDQGRVTAHKHWRNGKEHGPREIFQPDGRRSEQLVQDDRLEGPHREYDAAGRLLLEGQYSADLMQGRWVSYFPDGSPQWERHYRDDRLDGAEHVWRAAGKLESQGAYQAGQRHGNWIEWDASGHKLVEGDYRSGRRHGAWTFFDEGRPIRQTTYQEGKVVQTRSGRG